MPSGRSRPSWIASGLIIRSGISCSISVHLFPISRTIALSLSGSSSWTARMVTSCPPSLHPTLEAWPRLDILSAMSDSSLAACRVGTGRPAHGPMTKHAIGKLAAAGGGDRAGREAPDAILVRRMLPEGISRHIAALRRPVFGHAVSAVAPGLRARAVEAVALIGKMRKAPLGYGAPPPAAFRRGHAPRFGAPVHGDCDLAEHQGCHQSRNEPPPPPPRSRTSRSTAIAGTPGSGLGRASEHEGAACALPHTVPCRGRQTTCAGRGHPSARTPAGPRGARAGKSAARHPPESRGRPGSEAVAKGRRRRGSSQPMRAVRPDKVFVLLIWKSSRGAS